MDFRHRHSKKSHDHESLEERGIRSELSDIDLKRLSEFIYTYSGIKMPPAKKALLEGRLKKRIKQLRIKTYKDYCDYVFSDQGMKNEVIHMVDSITTNKTDFFREPRHFEFITKIILPDLLKHSENKEINLKIWSAACSSGEEAYSLAMLLSNFAEKRTGLNYSILASDISTNVLFKALMGIYDTERTTPIPVIFRKKYLMRSKDPLKKQVRIIPALRERILFKRINLMDENLPVVKDLDMIFCRNAIIYFDRITQEKVINNLCRHLKPGGHLFLGHSETLGGMRAPLENVGNTIYRKYEV